MESEKIDQNADWLLENFVQAANVSTTNIGITLITHGYLVSGVIIGGKEYFEIMAEYSTDQITKDAFKSLGEDLYGNKKREENSETKPPTFIHLKDAKFYSTSGQPVPANAGVIWRGRINQISGFTVGTLEVTTNH